MTMTARVAACLLCCATAWTAGAGQGLIPAEADFPSALCPRLKAAPTIDGKLDDGAWRCALTIEGLPRPPQCDEGARRTEIHLGHDDARLYVAMRCAEPLAKQMSGKKEIVEIIIDFSPDGSRGIKIGLSADGQIPYMHRLTPSGWEMAVEGPKHELYGEIQHAAQVEEQAWTVEAALPFKALGAKPGDVRRANFCRVRAAGGEGEYGAWMPTRSFLYTAQMGFLRCADAPAFSAYSEASSDPGRGTNAIPIAITGSGPGRVVARAYAWQGTQTVFAVSDAVTFTTGGRQRATPVLNIPWQGNFRIGLELADAETGEVVYRVPSRAIEATGRLKVGGLMPAYYNDDDTATFHVRLNMPENELAGCKLATTFQTVRSVPKPGARPLPERGMTRLASSYFPGEPTVFGEAGLSGFFSVRERPEGLYRITFRLLREFRGAANSGSGVAVDVWENEQMKYEVIEKEEHAFYIIDPPVWKAEPLAKIEMGAQGELRVNGKPFLPLSVYSRNALDYPLIRRHGFTVAKFYGIKNVADLQDAARALREIDNPGLYVHLVLSAANINPTQNIAKCRLAEKNPYVLLYEQSDELLGYFGTWRHEKIPLARQVYEEIRRTDPVGRLFYATTVAGPCVYAFGDSVFAKYLTFADILAPDVYAIGNCPLSAYYDFANKAARVARARGKTCIFVPQGNATDRYRWPDPAEVRSQAFMAIMGGARGLNWYTYEGTGSERGLMDNPSVWSAMKKLNRDLIGLTECLALPEATAGLAVEPAFGMRAWHVAGDKTRGVFVANGTYVPRRIKMTLPGLKAGTALNVHGEYRTVTSRDGGWDDEFEPLAVHVYRFQK
jgi:hypothetical protein